MTLREAYFKAYALSDKSLGMLFYTFKEKGVERIGNTPWLQLKQECHEDNIKSMESVEAHKGFMFWNISDEADKHIAGKSKKMKNILSTMIFMQR